MARDPDEGGAFVFDLDDDTDCGGAPSGLGPGAAMDGAPDGDVTGTGRPPASGVLGPSLRTVAPAAAVLAIALGTGFAADSIRDAARIERIRDVTGGVVDLSRPLEELWTWEGEVGSRLTVRDEGAAQVAVLGEVLAFQSEGALVALDPASGEEAWVLPLGEEPVCGPTGYAGWDEVATSALVCLQGAGADRQVITVGPDGAASAPRVLAAADTPRHGSARPGPDGTVLRARQVGPPSAVDLGDAECTPSGGCRGTVEAGRAIVLRAEDAVTGAPRWSLTVPFESTRAEDCNPWFGTSWDGSPSVVGHDHLLDAQGFGAQVGTVLVDLLGCGVRASVTSDGVRLGGGIEVRTGGVDRLATGGYAATGVGDVPHTVVYTAGGVPLETVAGYAYEAWVADDSSTGMLLAAEEAGAGLHAYGPDGRPRWDGRPESRVERFVAEVNRTAVVLTADGVMRGLDVATGRERWARTGLDGSDDTPFGAVYVYQAFTDGRHVLLLMYNEPQNAGLVSLDAASGEVVWAGTMADAVSVLQDALLLSVDGHLLAVTPLGVRGLG